MESTGTSGQCDQLSAVEPRKQPDREHLRPPANFSAEDVLISVPFQLYTASYDCSLRRFDLATATSTEIFATPDDDALFNQFDLTPDGNQIWISDSDGGMNHLDMREGKHIRRRYVIAESLSAAGKKVGGFSINREFAGYCYRGKRLNKIDSTSRGAVAGLQCTQRSEHAVSYTSVLVGREWVTNLDLLSIAYGTYDTLTSSRCSLSISKKDRSRPKGSYLHTAAQIILRRIASGKPSAITRRNIRKPRSFGRERLMD